MTPEEIERQRRMRRIREQALINRAQSDRGWMGNSSPGGGIYSLASDTGGGDGPFPITNSILGAGGLDYAFYDSGLASSLFQDAAGTTPAVLTNPVGLWNVRQRPPHYASQASAGSRPVLQSDGLKFDGSDDNLLTDWFAQAGANCGVALVTFPAGSATETFIFGSKNINERFALSFNPGSQVGGIGGGVGDSNASTLRDITNYGGQTIVVGLSCDGTTDRLFTPAGETTRAQVGIPNGNRAQRIGALDNNGTVGLFFNGSIKRIAFGKTALTLAQFQQIQAEWLAAA